MAVIESNQMRRAHRIDIPLVVVVNGVAYKSKDWSMTGVGIDDLNIELKLDDIIDASIVLALKEAKIEIPVKLQFKVKRGSVSGFEFNQISEKNKRVLREFLELSIEGKLEHIDGLISIYNEPVINSPIKETVVLSDEEDSLLKKEFLKRSKLYIKLAIAFFILLIATVYYNTSYVYRSIGTVSGNFIKIAPNISGKIRKIDVKVGDKISKQDILFELDDKMILNKIDIIDAKLINLKNYGGGNTQTTKTNSQLLRLLKKELNRTYNSYKSAQELYREKIITINDLRKVEESYSRARIKYLQEKNRYSNQRTGMGSSSSIISLVTQFELKREELINTLNYLRVFSPFDGVVYAIKSHKGDYVNAKDEVIVLETDEVSFVVCKLKQDEALKIKKGMEVKIYASSTDETYSAHVETIGNLSLNTKSEITNEVSLKEVTLKVVFDDKNVRLPLNERVKVWFYRPLL